MAVIPPSNLPPDSQPWGRYVTSSITDLSMGASMLRTDIDNNQRANSAQFNNVADALTKINQTLVYLSGGTAAAYVSNNVQPANATGNFSTITATKPTWAKKFTATAFSSMSVIQGGSASAIIINLRTIIIADTTTNGVSSQLITTSVPTAVTSIVAAGNQTIASTTTGVTFVTNIISNSNTGGAVSGLYNTLNYIVFWYP